MVLLNPACPLSLEASSWYADKSFRIEPVPHTEGNRLRLVYVAAITVYGLIFTLVDLTVTMIHKRARGSFGGQGGCHVHLIVSDFQKANHVFRPSRFGWSASDFLGRKNADFFLSAGRRN